MSKYGPHNPKIYQSSPIKFFLALQLIMGFHGFRQKPKYAHYAADVTVT